MWRWRRAYLISLAVIGALTLLAGYDQPRVLDDLRNFAFDSFQRLVARHYDRDAPVRIVAVDEESLSAYGQWPWPRTRLAELTERLQALGAAAIAFDMYFTEADRTSLESVVGAMPPGPAKDELLARLPDQPSNDEAFAKSLATAPVVLGMVLLASGEPRALPPKAGFVAAGDPSEPFLPRFAAAAAPLDVLTAAAKGLGAAVWLPDRDQIIRRVPLLVRTPQGPVPALSLEALRVAQDASTFIVRASNASGQSALGGHSGVNAIKVGSLEIATGARAEVRPRYTHTTPDRYVSVHKVLSAAFDRSEIEGRIVFVGASAVGLGDVRATPLDAVVPGVEVHAQVVEAVLAGNLLIRPDWAQGAELFTALVFLLGVALLLPAAPPFVCGLLGIVCVGALGVASFLAFDRYDVLLDPTFPGATILATYLAGTLALWRGEQLAKQHVRAAFGKFVSPDVVARLAENPRRLVLGGETRDLSVLFSDLRNFSTLAEGLEAHELTRFMNDYLTPMTDAVLEHGGTVDKYIGDAIVAFWNAPLDVSAHEARAVATALQMRAELTHFNRRRRELDDAAGRRHQPAAMGIGLNSGPCSVGNMGSIRRFDYSILGDTVNLASRLEGVSKIFGVDIVASAAVREQTPALAWIELDVVRVKGRAAPTAVFTLLGDEAFARSSEFQDWARRHAAILASYRAQEFAQAAALTRTLSGDVPPEWRELYAVIDRRLSFLAERPPDSGWSPVWDLDTK